MVVDEEVRLAETVGRVFTDSGFVGSKSEIPASVRNSALDGDPNVVEVDVR
jgi:hypothetical protein